MSSTKHTRNEQEEAHDRKKLREVAIVWWAHKIAELAKRACQGGADPAKSPHFNKVISTLEACAQALGGSAVLPVELRYHEVAILWWTQKLSDAGRGLCQSEANPYAEKSQQFNAVIRQLVKCAEGLNKVHLHGADAEKANAALHVGLYAQKDAWEQHYGRPVKPSENCESNEDCPEGYYCEGGFCESLFP